jgi:uncharacterized protein (TIGR00255 family)
MIKSMTGYASLTREDDRATVAVSVKTVNHRFLDLQLRIPQAFGDAETRVRQVVAQRVARGRVDLAVSVQLRTPPQPVVELNVEFAAALAAALDGARASGLVVGPLSPGDLLRMPQAVVVKERKDDVDPSEVTAMAAVIEATVVDALGELDAMRTLEGGHLRQDLDGRRTTLAAFADKVRAAADAGRAGLETRLQERIQDLRLDAPVDESLIAQEVVRFAARSDISEELTRLCAHLAHWAALTDAAEPCGRKLDFLLQEMNREVNTIGSKADGLGVTELIIAAKAELEKMREQVANVE